MLKLSKNLVVLLEQLSNKHNYAEVHLRIQGRCVDIELRFSAPRSCSTGYVSIPFEFHPQDILRVFESKVKQLDEGFKEELEEDYKEFESF